VPDRSKTIHGMLWAALSVIISRVGSFATQLIAAWYLLPEDFGVYASVYSICAVMLSLKNGNLISVLLHKNENQRVQLLRFSSYINVALTLIMIIFSFNQVSHEKSALFIIFSSVVLLSVYGLKVRLFYSIKKSFRELGRFEVYCSLIQNIFTIAALVCGGHLYSLAIGFLSVSVFEYFYSNYIYFNKKPIAIGKITKIIVDNSSDIKWSVASALVMGLSLQGDYIALSINTSAYILGVYFFAFQLTASISQLLTTAIRSVITPTLVEFKYDSVRLSQEYLFYSEGVMLASAIFYIFGISVAGSAMIFIWENKWLDAIPVVNILLLSLVARFQLPMLYSLIEATGRWKLKFYILFFDVIGIVTVSLLSSFTNDILAIGFSIGVYRLISVFLFIYLAGFYIKNTLLILKKLTLIVVISVAVFIINFFNPNHLLSYNSILSTSFILIIYLAMLFVFFGNIRVFIYNRYKLLKRKK
jgi:O-antigen/teichoic acid export membrane protein